MSMARQLFRTLIPTPLRLRVYRLLEFYFYKCQPYQRKFGTLRGLQVFYKLHYQKRGQITIRIPQSKTPITLRADTSDVPTFIEVFFTGEYAMDVESDPKLIIDGGANIGLTSVYFSNKYPRARVLAVEPDASNFEMLQLNTVSYPNITAIRSAIWYERRRLKIANPNADKWMLQVEPAESDEDSVESVTIDDLLGIAGADSADILKLDIEGAEKEVLTYNRDWLRRVKVMIIEVHDHFKRGCRDALFSATAAYNLIESRRTAKEDVLIFCASGSQNGNSWRAGGNLSDTRLQNPEPHASEGEIRTDPASMPE